MNEKDKALAALRMRNALPELRQRWPIRSLALSGSAVRVDASPASDRDILVEFERPIGLLSFLALEQELSALTGCRVDRVSRPAMKGFSARQVLGEALLV